MDTGSLLASGRDADIYEYGPRLVLRRSRGGRLLTGEAEVMEHVREAGYPAPRVEELRGGGSELVMERLEGPLMGELLVRQPWRLAEMAKLLAMLHADLGAIKAPPGLPQLVRDGGDAVVHLDLHPYNVVMTGEGPVVIDWSSASRGQPATDVAATWVLVRSSEIPGRRLDVALGRLGRGLFLQAFLGHCDKRAAREALPSVIQGRLEHATLTDNERRFLVSWARST